jgi:undecaprenyl-phosphate 4-deoxy-4-formamido-L-arabinose transferase
MVPMNQRERGDDRSTGFTFRKSIELFTNGLTAFSVKPLRIASILGVLFALVGFIYGLVIVIRKLMFPDIPVGYSSMMAVQVFSSGIIMLILGMIGEYLGRIYISLNNSPQYVVRTTKNLVEENS